MKIEAEIDGWPLSIVLFSFNNNFLNSYYPIGQKMVISGELTSDGRSLTMIHPDYSVKPDQCYKIPKIEPIYSSIPGLGNRVLRKIIGNEINNLNPIKEWLPKKFIEGKIGQTF